MFGALSLLKVLDFTTLLPGPRATMLLADMGADVLRIVSPSRPDLVDLVPPFLPGAKNISAFAAHLGRNKRTLPLNLKNAHALEVIHRLIKSYDIIIEQFRPGVMAKLRLDYENLAGVHPQIIYCSLTGYGQTGRLRSRAGHDINYIARSGIASYGGGNQPSLLGIQIADVASGSNNALIGILAAVIHRLQTGQGQHIDIAMLDGMIAFNTLSGAGYLVDGKEPTYESGILNGGSLYDYYETKDGRYLSVGCIEPQFFSNFCDVIERQDLKAGGIMPKEIIKIKAELRELFLTKTLAEWVSLFDKTEACVEPVLSLAEVLDGESVRERGLIVDTPLAAGGSVKQLANPIKFSHTPPAYQRAGTPTTREKIGEILAEFGYSKVEIAAMEKSGLFS